MTYEQILPYNGKHVIITKKSGARYDGVIRQIKNIGGGKFILTDVAVIIKNTNDSWRFPKTHENRKVWASKIIKIEEIK